MPFGVHLSKMSEVNPAFYDHEGYTMFPCSPVEVKKTASDIPEEMISCNSSNDKESSSSDELLADDEMPSIHVLNFRETTATSSASGSKRSTPRPIVTSRNNSPRSTKFDMTVYFTEYRLQCVDITSDVRSIAIASAKLHCLYNFAPSYFQHAPEGLWLDELRNEYDLFLSHVDPSPSTAIRIGQLTEKIKSFLL